MQLSITICLIAIGISFLLKIIFWLRIRRKSTRFLLRSFFRYYSIYDMHDAPSPEHLTFWKLSNVFNFIIWIALSILAISYFLTIPMIDK